MELIISIAIIFGAGSRHCFTYAIARCLSRHPSIAVCLTKEKMCAPPFVQQIAPILSTRQLNRSCIVGSLDKIKGWRMFRQHRSWCHCPSKNTPVTAVTVFVTFLPSFLLVLHELLLKLLFKYALTHACDIAVAAATSR